MHKDIDLAVKKIGETFKEKHLSLVLAESCTGGGIAFHISHHPDCSSILERGYVVYSMMAKEDLLAVKASTLQVYGPVSKKTALEMARGALQKSVAHISVATTGIAGVDNDLPNNIGIVWIAFSSIFGDELVVCKKIKGKREHFVDETILVTLKLLLRFVKKMK